MTDFMEPPQDPEADPQDLGAPAAAPRMATPQLTQQTLGDIASGALARHDTDKALQSGDLDAYFRGIQQQRKQAGMASVQVGMAGGDPLYQTAPIGQYVDPKVEMERRFIEMAKRDRALDEVLNTNGYGDIQAFLKDVAEQYRTQNQEPLIKKPENEQQWLAQVRQMSPVIVDPNLVANVRQQAVKLDQAMKAVDPTFSFWTHPKTRKAAEWLNREAGGGQVGYFTSDEQKLNIGVTGTAAMMGVEAIEGAADFGLQFVHGMWDLADQGTRALGGDGLGPLTPTNYIEGENGELIPNGGKVPGFLDSMNMLWAEATGQNVLQAAASMNRTREMELASRNGFQTIALGGSRIFGMGIGFGLPAGAAMNAGAQAFGQLGTRGMHWLGTLGMKGAQSQRALKITRLMAGGLGAGIANGMAEGVAYGRAEGYGAAFMHGMAMAPVLLALGAMGRRAEWFAEKRLKMPKRVAAQVGAALEGVGFGAMEAGTLPFMPAAWDFIRNPNEETWETYAKNIAGFMFFKAATRGRSPNPGTEAIALAATQARRAAARATFAEQAVRGQHSEETIRQAVEAAGGTLTVEQLRGLGEASMRAREGRTPEERAQALQEKRRIEAELDAAEFGMEPPAEAEVRALEPEGTGEPDLMARAQERIERTRSEIEGMTPEELTAWGKRNFEEGQAMRAGELEQAEAARAARQRETAADPLEDPRFGELPEAVREAIIAAPDVQARRDIMLREAPERRKSQMGLPEGVTGERRGRPDESGARAEMFGDLEGLEFEPGGPPIPKGSDLPKGHSAFLSAVQDAGSTDKPPRDVVIRKLERARDQGHPEAAEALRNLDVWIAEQRSMQMQRDVIAGEQAEQWRQRQKERQAEEVARDFEEAFERGELGMRAEMRGEADEGAWKFLDEKVYEREASRAQPAFRKMSVRWMPIEEFIRTSERFQGEGETDYKAEGVKEIAERGEKFETPLTVVYEDGKIVNVDGRHRAGLMQRSGVKRVPVLEQRIETGEAGETRAELRPTQDTGERAGPGSLQVPPTRQLKGHSDVQPVRAADIYLEMSGRPGRKGFRIPWTTKRVFQVPGDPVRVAIATGRIKGGGTLGYYAFFENLMRTQEGRDLVVATHEWAHAMHRHTLGAMGRMLPKEAAAQRARAEADTLARTGVAGLIERDVKEILKDYPGADRLPAGMQWMEAWAEWHARNMLGEVGLDAKFPALSHWMRNWLAQPQQAALRGQYQRIQSMLDRYNRQGSYQRERQSMFLGTDKPSEAELAQRPSKLSKWMEDVNVALFDDMARLKKSQDKWLEATGRDPADVNIMDDPARLYDALSMTSGKTAEFFVRRGIRTEQGDLVRGLEPIMRDLKGLEEQFVVYLSAVRNAQLWKRGKKPTLPIADHLENIRTLQRQHPQFRQRARELKQWSDALIDYVARSGNMDPAVAQRIKDSYVVYVPFFRAIEGPRPHPQARGVAEGGTGLKRIEGSTFEIRDPLVAMQDVAQRLIAKAHQNIVMSGLYKLATGHEAGGLATIVPKAKVPKDHPLRQIIAAIEKGVDFSSIPGGQNEVAQMMKRLKEMDALDPQTATLFFDKVIPTGERNVVAFTPRLTEAEIKRIRIDPVHEKVLRAEQGKLQWIEINDPKVYEALMGIDQMPQIPAALQPFMRWIKGPRDLVRFFATGVAPGFVAANLIRDALSYPMFTRDGDFRPLGGLFALVRGAIEYHRNGEVRELYETMGVKTSSFFSEGEKQDIAGQRGARGIVEHSIIKAKHWAQRAQDFFSHPENYLRVEEFKRTYEKAKADGVPEAEARMLALEAGREITVNFARAGILSRVLNQSIPYFNAGMQGKRKLWGQLLYGGDVKGDAAKARVQRGAILNGLANITAPTFALWLMNRNEEWFQDLPEWRKSGYWNMRIGDDIISIPKPFEAGALFGAIPEALLESAFDENGNPISFRRAALDTLGAYTEGIGSLLPAVLKPIVELDWNYSSFADRPLTPDWIMRSAVPEEQSTFYTTETAKILSRAVNGVLTPIEIEHMLGSYTAGASTSAFRALEELAGVRDHPAAINPVGRFFKQRPFGQSRYVDQLYDLSVELDQLQGSDKLTADELRLRSRVQTAKRSISDLRSSYREGRISQAEAEERSYQIARPLIEEWNQ